MPSDSERLCHVPWLLTQWLGTSRQKPEPMRAPCVLTDKCVFHLSSQWPEDSAGLTCPHPQSLTSWTPKITPPRPCLSLTLCWPCVWLLSKQLSEPVMCFSDLAMDYLSVAFSFRYMDDMAENMCSILFTVRAGWKVKAQSKQRPLTGSEMTAPTCMAASACRCIQDTESAEICWRKKKTCISRIARINSSLHTEGSVCILY